MKWKVNLFFFQVFLNMIIGVILLKAYFDQPEIVPAGLLVLATVWTFVNITLLTFGFD